MFEDNLWAEITDDFNAKDDQALSPVAPPLAQSQQPSTFTPHPLSSLILEDLWGELPESHPPNPLLPPPPTAYVPSTQGTLSPSTPRNNSSASSPNSAGGDAPSTLADDLWSLEEEEPFDNEAPEIASERDALLFQAAPESANDLYETLNLSGTEQTSDFFATFDRALSVQEYGQGDDPFILPETFTLLDVEAELAEQERLEAEALSRRAIVEERPERGRIQAPGWLGSSSLLYINWEEGAKAEQEALERLGYSQLSLSEATRAFVIQAARAYQINARQERHLMTQLTHARSHLAQLLTKGFDTPEQSKLEALIVELEKTLWLNLQWVAVKKAPAFLGQGVELDDLIQAGMLGIIAGIRHFDNTKGARLISVVSWWVFQALSRAVLDYGRLIRLPVYVHEAIAQIKKQQTDMETHLGCLPTHQELADAVHLSKNQVEELQQADKTIVSLSHYIRVEYAHEGYSFQVVEEEALILDEDALAHPIYQVTLRTGVDTLLECLTKRERKVIRLRYGLDSEDGHKRTLEEVASKLNVTRERIRQIEERALRKLLGHYPSSEIAEIYPYPQNTKKKQPK
jgi:RNA polymerase sigma factor (sigma-70 family)